MFTQFKIIKMRNRGKFRIPSNVWSLYTANIYRVLQGLCRDSLLWSKSHQMTTFLFKMSLESKMTSFFTNKSCLWWQLTWWRLENQRKKNIKGPERSFRYNQIYHLQTGRIKDTARSIIIVPSGRPSFWLMNSRGKPLLEGCMLMNSNSRPPFGGLYVNEF